MPSKHEDDDIDPELEAIYEPPPSQHPGGAQQHKNLKHGHLSQNPMNSMNVVAAPGMGPMGGTPSESDEPQYSGQSLYGRAPSVCSSVSATQSFDLRMYGRLPRGNPPASTLAHPASAGILGQQQQPGEEKK